ncbi:DUF4403 family protein [Desulfosarcina sp. OttesenSCG-928-A07]|nr:DUF4403 family protein [Desulfosarcina sp. OttesenSCG-928-G17]MDL2329085.1 DUF4403 family protein [Desulfosarcina sp. OttesenSCG-928-A07]
MIEFTFDTSEIEHELARIAHVPYAIEKALFPVVSEVVEAARTDLSRRLSKMVALDPKVIKRSVKMSRPLVVENGVRAWINVSSKPIRLIEYDVQPRDVTARRGVASRHWPGFSYALRHGKRMLSESLMEESLPFITAIPRTGHLGVFRRYSKGISEVYGPKLQYHAAAPQIEERVIRGAELHFRELLPRIVSLIAEGAL